MKKLLTLSLLFSGFLIQATPVNITSYYAYKNKYNPNGQRPKPYSMVKICVTNPNYQDFRKTGVVGKNNIVQIMLTDKLGNFITTIRNFDPCAYTLSEFQTIFTGYFNFNHLGEESKQLFLSQPNKQRTQNIIPLTLIKNPNQKKPNNSKKKLLSVH